MHICIIASEFPPKHGGVGYYVYNLSKKLVDKGHKLTVITRGSWKKPYCEYRDRMDVWKTPFMPLYPFHVQLHGIFANRLFKSLESEFDVVHVHVPLPPLIHTLLPTLVTVHSLVELTSFPIRSSDFNVLAEKLLATLFHALEFETIRDADMLTAVSRFVAEEVQRHFGLDANGITIIGNGVDTNFFIPGKTNTNTPNVLYVGRLDYRKGLLDLVRGAKNICNEHPETLFIFVGTGPLKHSLEKLIRNLGLNQNFFFIEHMVDRNTLLKYYQNATIFALPSYYEGMPNVLLEAMACGIPVVATSIGGIQEIVMNEKTGLLVAAKDPEAISNAILNLFEDDKLRKEMGKASRKRIQKYYSWDIVSNKVLDCYKSVGR